MAAGSLWTQRRRPDCGSRAPRATSCWPGRTKRPPGARSSSTATTSARSSFAKAALYAGAKLLMRHYELKAVDRIVLAGAFGSYIDPQHAMVLGLILTVIWRR